jgi:hypothetical protein
MRSIGLGLALSIIAAAFVSACQGVHSPENSPVGDGGAGSTTPPGDYMSTGHSGLGNPVNEVGTDAGLPNVNKENRDKH